ncbi:MAG: hypothetical protein ACRDIE_12065 [Chloroflexota bacterium]
MARIWISDWCAVTGFLEREPFLHRLVRIAYQKIPTYFPCPCITVGVVDAPMLAKGPCLTLAVATLSDQAEASRRLDQFAQEWLRDALNHTHGKLCMVLLPGTKSQPAFDNDLIDTVLRARDKGYVLSRLEQVSDQGVERR